MQLDLIAGHYHCDNCGQVVEHVQRTRRFWLCDACWQAIVPAYDTIPTQDGKRTAEWLAEWAPVREQIGNYWGWYHDMEKRYPPRYTPPRKPLELHYKPVDADSLNPLCACGRPRQPMSFMITTSPGLFGGPFRSHCEVCEAKLAVESIFKMAEKIHQDWNDEDWLEYCWQHRRELYDVGVLPDYWFTLKAVQLP
ncbi:MAG: hypothetical protein IPK79_00245 [Vampirovibrionales bacterium]|nr:hypothetical protein [Vampirovibrionales bacterium]